MQTDLPPLPKIDGDVDLMLDVYTHSSLRFDTAPMNDDYGDTHRLAELGAKVLDLAVTYHLYSERPFLTQGEIQSKRVELLSDTRLDSWIQAYGLKEKLRAAPSEIHSVMNNPQEMTNFFHIYVGALYIRNGLPTIQNWISRLITPGADVRLPDASPQPNPAPDGNYNQQMPGQAPSQTSSYSSAYSPMSSQTYSPAPPNSPPPPLPGNPPVFNYAPSATLSLVTLALVNQTAAQRGMQVTYMAEQVGPPHQPTWTVKCFMGGIERGRGTGKSQKVAKEEAARQAWATMGWGPT
ncbi:hypothetical protein BDZ97DRAFT_1853487 [Flammula alnicola]|nr:hypothetical protein BDZ97DRAFT_1853487 [Flammula alnicola]